MNSYQMRFLAPASAVFPFQSNQNELHDPKGNKKNILCIIAKYGKPI